MAKVEIVVPKSAIPKNSIYACKCQKTEFKTEGKKAKVFWIAKLMDYVKKEELLCELEIQKTTLEVYSPCDGYLAEICIDDGDDCTMGNILAYLDTKD